uniref:Elp3/MiaA/NifB-like radical SAM core domain-containing protein n=1 Tax=Ignisphaera aggregans TaxID=334771 RepID=A0A7C2VGQ2_9CREN
MREVFRPRREINRVIKRGRPTDIKVGILVPLPYRAASSSLIMHMLYEYLNSLENVIAYRFVYDKSKDVIESLDHDISLRHLDLVLISASFELDYINVARILGSANLLPHQKKKPKPVTVAGGLAPTSNPLPLSSIVDAVVVGESEEVLRELVYAAQEDNPLKHLEGSRCIAMPARNIGAEKCFVRDLNNSYHPVMQVYSLDEEPIFGYGVRIELSRGCQYLCPFCMEAHVAYPFRFRSYTNALSIMNRALDHHPLMKRVVLYSLSFFSIPHADKLLDYLLNENIQASIPSLRPEHITIERLETMYRLGQKTLTIAPETLAEHFGCRIGKCSDLDHIANIVLEAYRTGYEHVKLYLITGFPGLDISEEITSLRKLLSKVASTIKRHRFIEISLNILIPKPWTPLQFMPPKSVLDNSYRVNEYRNAVKGYSFVSIEAMDPRWGFAQAVIAQGDKEVSKIVVECALKRCSLSQFIKQIRSDVDRLAFVDKGWGTAPPWYSIVNMGFNVKYLDLRYRYLSKPNN